MNRLEDDLRALLADRAGTVTAAPERHEKTLGRARTRRRVTATGAALAVVAFAAGTFAVVRGPLFESATVDPAGPGQTTTGPYGFTSTPGTGRVVATGTFRDTTWILRGERQRLESGQDGIRLELSIGRGEGQPAYEADTVVLPGDDVLQMAQASPSVLNDTDVVFGATVPGIHSVAIDFRFAPPQQIPGMTTSPSFYDSRGITPHRFSDYRPPGAVTADYYIAFVPSDEVGWVSARDPLGIDLDVEWLDDRDPNGVPRIASGKAGEQRTESQRASRVGLWSLAFRDERRRACFEFWSVRTEEECFARKKIERGRALEATFFDTRDVTGVVAILGDQVAEVRLLVEGEEPATLPWAQPPQTSLGRWPLRIAAVGVERGASGRLDAIGPGGGVLQSVSF